MSFISPKDFYEQFKNDSNAAKKTAFQIGRDMAQILKKKYNIQGGGLEAVAEILNATMRTVKGEQSAKVEGNRVTMHNTGFCAIMRAALTLGVPWEWLDANFAWPWLEGIVSLVKPEMKLRMSSARCRGDEACIHIFET